MLKFIIYIIIIAYINFFFFFSISMIYTFLILFISILFFNSFNILDKQIMDHLKQNFFKDLKCLILEYYALYSFFSIKQYTSFKLFVYSTLFTFIERYNKEMIKISFFFSNIYYNSLYAYSFIYHLLPFSTLKLEETISDCIFNNSSLESSELDINFSSYFEKSISIYRDTCTETVIGSDSNFDLQINGISNVDFSIINVSKKKKNIL